MSDFEKWFKTTEAYKMLEEQNYFKMDLFLFVEARNQYRHSGVQVAYLTWQHQQVIIDNLKAQLNNMEACYIEKKKELEDQLNRTKDACGRYDRLYEEYRLLELLAGNYRVLAQEVLPRCSRELLENIEGWEKALRGAND